MATGKSCWVAAAARRREAGIFSAVPGPGSGLINHAEQHRVGFLVLVPTCTPALSPFPRLENQLQSWKPRTARGALDRALGIHGGCHPRSPTAQALHLPPPLLLLGLFLPQGLSTCCSQVSSSFRLTPSALPHKAVPECPPAPGSPSPCPVYSLRST